MNVFVTEAYLVKNNTSVRKPALANSGKKGEEMSVGDVLRKAKKELLVKRIVYGLLLVLVASAVVVLISLGYIDRFIDILYTMLG